jgi:hypothetical protein
MAMAVEAAVSLWRGRFPEALKICEEAAAARLADSSTQAVVLVGLLAQARLLCGDPAGCVQTLLDGGGGPELSRFEASERPLWFRTLAQAELARDDIDAAKAWVERAHCAVTPGMPEAVRAFALLGQAELTLAQRDAGAARAAAYAAAVAFGEAEMPLYEASARAVAASALAALGDHAAGLEEEARVQVLFERVL